METGRIAAVDFAGQQHGICAMLADELSIIMAWCMPGMALMGSFCRETEISGATTISRIANSASQAARRLGVVC